MVGHASAANCHNAFVTFQLCAFAPGPHRLQEEPAESASGELFNVHNVPITPCPKYFARREEIWGGYSSCILLPSAKWSHVPFFFRTPALSRARFCKVLSPTVRGWVLSLSLPSVAMESTHYPSGMLKNTFQKWQAPSSTGARINNTGTD